MADQQSKPSSYKLQFESLLGELSANLVNLPLESIDAAIESSMKKLVEFFGADRCHLGEFSDDQSKIEVSYFYTRPGINIAQIDNIGEHFLSFVYESTKQDKLISFSKSSELPDDAEQDRAVLDKMGIKSLLIIPLKIDKEVHYAFSLANVNKHRQWEKQTINQINILANILAHVMQRKIALQQIVEEKEWSDAVIQGMPQMAYVFDLQGKMKRWNKNVEDILGYTSEELFDKYIGDFASDEDMERVMKIVQKIVEERKELTVEYGFITKSGEILPYYYGSGKVAEIGGELYIVGQRGCHRTGE